MSAITIPTATEAYTASQTAENAATENAIDYLIDNAIKCGQSSAVFSTKLSDDLIKTLTDKGYQVTTNGVNKGDVLQYIISWEPVKESEE